jgi:hypothetical protein
MKHLVLQISFWLAFIHGIYAQSKINDELIAYKELNANEYKGDLIETKHNFKFYPNPTIRLTDRPDTIRDENIYYGLYELENEYQEKIFVLQKIKIKKFETNDDFGLAKEDFHSVHELRPLFIFKGLNQKFPFIIHGKYINRYQLYPGDNFRYDTKKAANFIYVTGKPHFKDTTNFADFSSKIENVELHVQEEMNGQLVDSILYKVNMYQWHGGGFEGSIGIHWIGDLDADGKLDMILGYSNHYAYYEYSIYLSTMGRFIKSDTYTFND